MQPAQLATRLAANAQVFVHLLAAVSAEQARWKPAPEQWSLLEVINHLADEERADFRLRLDLTLHHHGEPWPPIDPPRWVVERSYNSRDLAASLADFLGEREQSVQWLQGLSDINLAAERAHPRLGRMTAGDLVGAWLAHDLLHLRQMTRLHYQYLAVQMAPHAVEYAGVW